LEKRNSSEALHEALVVMDGVTTGPGRFGSVTYYLGKREIGHVHGQSHADLPFPTKIRNELVEAGRAGPNHFLPQSGWVSVPLRGGIEGALDLFRLNYDLIARKKLYAETKEQG
jgi:Family of unknown function (DUF5519)